MTFNNGSLLTPLNYAPITLNHVNIYEKKKIAKICITRFIVR